MRAEVCASMPGLGRRCLVDVSRSVAYLLGVKSSRHSLFPSLAPLALVLVCGGALGISGAACSPLKDSIVVPDPIDGAPEPVPTEPTSEPDSGPPPEADAQTPDASRDAATKDASPCVGACPPETLATGLSQATAITVDANNVYFAVEGGTASVYECPKTGCKGSPRLLGTGYTFAISRVGQKVYFADYSGGRILACAVGGCAQQPEVIASSQLAARGTWTDGTYLYWSVYDATTQGEIRRCLPDACTPTTLVANAGTVFDLAAEQGTLIWGSRATSTVYACSTFPCTTPRTLGAGSTGVISASGKAFWVNGTSKIVVSCAIGGCTNPSTLGNSFAPTNPASDGTSVYWRDDISADIFRCPMSGCGGAAQTLVKNQRGQPRGGIATDGLYVYWTTASGVYRLPK